MNNYPHPIIAREGRPFVAVTVAAAIAGGAHIQLVFHPILTVAGNKQSLIVFVIDPLADDAARTRLIASLEDEQAVLAGQLAHPDFYKKTPAEGKRLNARVAEIEEQLLAALGNLCLIPCEEYDDLKRALAAYKKLAAR